MSNAPITRNTRLVTARLPRDLAEWAGREAARRGVTLTQVIADAIAAARETAREALEGHDVP